MLLPPKSLKRSRKLIFSFLALTLILIAGAVTFAFTIPRQPDPLSQAAKKMPFPLIVPIKPPEDIKLDVESISTTPEVATYRYTYDNNKYIVASVMPIYNRPDFNKFKASKEYKTSVGKVYLVDLEDRTTAAVVGPKSWMIINIPGGNTEIMRNFINTLHQLPQDS